MTDSSNIKCEIHEDRTVRYVCLFEECTAEPKSCIICIKNNHTDCPSNLIVKKEFFLKNLKINNTQHNDFLNHKDYIKKLIDQLGQETYSKLLRSIQTKTRTAVNMVDKSIDVNSSSDLEILCNHFQVLYNKEREEVEFKNISHMTKSELEKSLSFYNLQFKRLLNSFLSSLERVSFSLRSLSVKDFDFCTNHIVMTNTKKGVQVNRIAPTVKNYSCFFFSEPLENHVFKIKINTVHTDAFLDIGITTGSRYKAIIKNINSSLSNSFGASGNVSYCGTSTTRMKNLNPVLKKHEPGTVIYLKYDSDMKKVEIYDEGLNLNLVNSGALSSSEDYYFFVSLHYPESSCEVELESS